MKTRIAALAILLVSIGSGVGVHATQATASTDPVSKGKEWFCAWIYATDFGYCQENPLPPELPIPPG